MQPTRSHVDVPARVSDDSCVGPDPPSMARGVYRSRRWRWRTTAFVNLRVSTRVSGRGWWAASQNDRPRPMTNGWTNSQNSWTRSWRGTRSPPPRRRGAATRPAASSAPRPARGPPRGRSSCPTSPTTTFGSRRTWTCPSRCGRPPVRERGWWFLVGRRPEGGHHLVGDPPPEEHPRVLEVPVGEGVDLHDYGVPLELAVGALHVPVEGHRHPQHQISMSPPRPLSGAPS